MHALASSTLTVLRDVRLALRAVLRHRRRSATALLSVIAGVVALVLAGGFIDWIYWSMRENTIGSRLGHLQVVRPGYLDSGAANPLAYLIPDDPALRQRIAAIPHVDAVAPRVKVNGLLSHVDSTISFLGEGIDPRSEAPFDAFVIIAAGQRMSESVPDGIIVGKGLANNAGIKPGDRVVLVVNRRSGGVNAVEATVRGLFATATKAYDDTALRMPIEMAQRLLGTSAAHAWVVILDDTDRTDEAAAQIRAIVGSRQLDVVPWYDQADFYLKTVALFSKQVAVLKLIIAIIIVLSVSNTLMMNVLERTAEIGTMMALGANAQTVLRRFLSEGIVIGAVGGAFGIAVAVVLALVISAVGIPMPPPPGMDHGFIGQVRLSTKGLSDAFVLAVTTAVVASWYPAWRASRMIIVDALRHAR
jgi:putative ABC transport system permease protein